MAVEPDRTERLRQPRQRNLFLGWVAVAVGVLLFAAAVTLAGPAFSFVALLSAGVAIAVLWLLWRLGILQQPRGLFLGGSITVLAALLVPLAGGVIGAAMKSGLLRPPPPRDAPVVQIAPPSDRSGDVGEVPLLSAVFPVNRPDETSDSWVEVTKDSRIRIDGSYYRIEAGERFILRRVSDGEVIFNTRDFLVSLPINAVVIHRPEREADKKVEDDGTAATPVAESKDPIEAGGESRLEITRRAQTLAIERYPALQVPDSRENRSYVEAYLKLRESNPEFFEDPEWPLQLAEAMAERDGWKREDVE